MKNITRWSPDTCGCVLEYEWDTEASNDDREHTFVSMVKVCPDHEGLDKDHIHYGHVVAENTTKNRVHTALHERIPRLQKTKMMEDGRASAQLDPEIEFKWRFEGKGANRELVVDIEGGNLTKEEKALLLEHAQPFRKVEDMGKFFGMATPEVAQHKDVFEKKVRIN